MIQCIAYLLTIFLLIQFSICENCDPEWMPKNKLRNLRNNYYQAENDVKVESNSDTSTLKLVHVVFRHGHRAPDVSDLYPLDPFRNFSFYPVGFGQLTNLGKMQEYKIGVALRKRYNSFLGDLYTPEVLDATSTDYNRTKMSLELMLAGLWPPINDNKWNDALPWQPIPYNYQGNQIDTLLGDPMITCPRFKKLYDCNTQTNENKKENDALKEFYDYINQNTGGDYREPLDIYNLYFCLATEEGWPLILPNWTECVYPHKIIDIAIKHYIWSTQTKELKSLSAGILLNKLVNDTELLIQGLLPKERKLFIYSSHERNVAFTLISLGVYFPHVPPYASYVLVEVHQIDGTYGIKVFYQDYSENEPKLLTIPGCDTFCPYEQFYKLIQDVLPITSCFDD